MSSNAQDPPEPGGLPTPATPPDETAPSPPPPPMTASESTSSADVPSTAASESTSSADPPPVTHADDAPPAARPTDEILARVEEARSQGTLAEGSGGAPAAAPTATPAPQDHTSVLVEAPPSATVNSEPAPTPTPGNAGAHPFARDEDRGIDPIALLPIVLAVLVLLGGIWKCSRGDEAPDSPVADEVVPKEKERPAVVVEEGPPRARIPELPPRLGTPEEASVPIAAPPIGEYDGPPLAPGRGGDKDAEAMARQAEEHYRAGRLEEALDAIDSALGRSRNQSRYEALRGLILHAQHRDAEALDQFNKAVLHDAKNPELYRQRATIQVALGRHAHASRDVRAYDRLKAGTSPTQPP